MRRAGLISVALHLLFALGFLLHFPDGSAPEKQWAKVELIQQDTPNVGSGARDSGHGQDPAPAAAAQPVPESPPPAPPTPPSTADLPPVPEESKTADTPPPPPRQNDAAVLPRPKPKSAERATPQAARAPPPAPPMPPPAPQTDAPAGEPADPPEIRLGDGGNLGTALVSGDNVIPAAMDSHIHNVQPAYPAEAARRGEEGTVMLMVHVNPDGSAAGVDVQGTSGFERLDRAARDAVARWHFRPAVQYGGAVASDMPVRVRFVLKE